jgi:hypothetical protein
MLDIYFNVEAVSDSTNSLLVNINLYLWASYN